MRIALALVVTLIAIEQSSANETIVMKGLGAASCAQFSQLYATNPATTESIYLNWTHGFMTGLNAARWPNGPYRDLSAETDEQRNADIRAYCKSHPLANYMEAVMASFMSLPLRPRQ